MDLLKRASVGPFAFQHGHKPVSAQPHDAAAGFRGSEDQGSKTWPLSATSLGHAWDLSVSEQDMDYVAADQGFITEEADLLFAALPLEPDEAVAGRPMVRSIYRTCGAAAAQLEVEEEEESAEMLWEAVIEVDNASRADQKGVQGFLGVSSGHTTDPTSTAEKRKAVRNTHCPSFVRTGHCVRGNTCAFLHCQYTFEERRPGLGHWGNPLRPDELTCPVSKDGSALWLCLRAHRLPLCKHPVVLHHHHHQHTWRCTSPACQTGHGVWSH
jgi:hypothetical protein